MKKMILLGMMAVLGACASSDKQIADYLKKNPKAVFDVIEDNPEQFVEVVNKAARKAQQNQQKKQIAEMKKQQEQQIINPLKPALSDARRLQGTANAKITIVEYADFQCPACGMSYPVIKEVMKEHAGNVQLFYKHMPLSFHPMAEPAAYYFEAIFKQDRTKALKFYDLLFENQRSLKNVEFIRQMAKKAGADMGKVAKDISSPEIQKIVKDDMSEFEKLGFTGTPVIVVNGVALHGAQPKEEVDKIIALTTLEAK
jgi:protein-disulfide isomerase